MIFRLKNIHLTTHYDNEEMVKLLNSVDNNAFAGSQLGRLPLFMPKLNDNNNLIFAIMFNVGVGHIIAGRVSVEDISYINQTGELKIFIGKEYQQKGYSYEACRKIIDHCFDELNLHRIYCGTLENNVGMQKLADKLGMVKEGQRKQAVYKNGKFVDVIEYGLIKE